MVVRKKTTKESAKSTTDSIIPRDYGDWLANLSPISPVLGNGPR
jgi:hypothetical protein